MDSRVFFGHTAQRAAGRAGADVGIGVHRQVLHARLVAQNRTTRHSGRGIDREHRHAVALPNQVQAQRFDEGGLAHARHTADAQPEGLSGVGQQTGQQLIGQQAVVSPGGFEQRDRLGHGAALHRRSAVQ